MFYEYEKRDRKLLPYDPFKALIAPRPVGWVSTMNKAGEINLAPYSFFNAFSGAPPLIGFSSDGEKDSATFAQETGEFVWNLATWELRDHMNDTSAPLPRGEACRRMAAAGSIGRAGHARDESVSTYDRNLGRDPCRYY